LNDLVGEVFKSIHLITDNKIRDLRLDKTVQAIIINQIQNNLYRITYQGVEYDAYSTTNQIFNSGDSVLVLIPENNFTNKKLILGLTAKTSQNLSLNFLAAVTGSATTPSISFANDLDTGFYNSAINNVACSLSGSYRYSFAPDKFLGQATDIAGIRISSNSTVSLANDSSLTISLTTAGALLISAYDQGSGTGSLWLCNYTNTAFLLAATSLTAATDTAGSLCVFKSANSHTITLRNRLGTTRNISIAIFGASTG